MSKKKLRLIILLLRTHHACDCAPEAGSSHRVPDISSWIKAEKQRENTSTPLSSRLINNETRTNKIPSQRKGNTQNKQTLAVVKFPASSRQGSSTSRPFFLASQPACRARQVNRVIHRVRSLSGVRPLAFIIPLSLPPTHSFPKRSLRNVC